MDCACLSSKLVSSIFERCNGRGALLRDPALHVQARCEGSKGGS